MTPDDLGLFVTYSGQYQNLIGFGQYFKKRNVPFITLTANASSPLAKLSTETVLFKNMERWNKDEKIATFYSQLVFSFILNSIYSLLYSKRNNK